jgi:hypothetical protein
MFIRKPVVSILIDTSPALAEVQPAAITPTGWSMSLEASHPAADLGSDDPQLTKHLVTTFSIKTLYCRNLISQTSSNLIDDINNPHVFVEEIK